MSWWGLASLPVSPKTCMLFARAAGALTIVPWSSTRYMRYGTLAIRGARLFVSGSDWLSTLHPIV